MSDTAAVGGWSGVELREITDRRTERNPGGNDNVLTIAASEGLISQAEYFNRIVASNDLRPYYLLNRGDFAYNKSYSAGYPVGVIRRLDRYGAGVVSPLYICFRPRSSAPVHSDFLAHFLAAGMIDEGIAAVAKEGARNHGLLNVGTSDFFGVEMLLPPLEEQRRIAEVLDTIDDTIRATERIIDKARKVLVGVGSDLLSGGTPTPIRDLILDEWAGEWGAESPAEGLSPVLVLRATNIDGYHLDYDIAAERYVPASKAHGKQLRDGDIMLEGAGGGPGVPVGRVSRFNRGSEPGDAYLTSNFFRALRPAQAINADYLYWLLDHEYRKPSIWSCQQQTTGIINLKLRDYLDRRVAFNPDRQELIAQTLDDALSVLDHHQEELHGLRSVRSGLAADLLSGRVRTTSS